MDICTLNNSTDEHPAHIVLTIVLLVVSWLAVSSKNYSFYPVVVKCEGAQGLYILLSHCYPFEKDNNYVIKT